MSQGPLALVGSGEYLPVMAAVEGMLLRGRPPRYVQIPTAAAREGEQSLRRWLDLGAAQAERLGVEQIPVVARDRDDADASDLADLIEGAGLIYPSGGDPAYLAATLRGSRVWAAVVTAWRNGSGLAGCSAGAIALTGWVPSIRTADAEPDPGLAVLPGLRVLPHFDRMLTWAPDLVSRAATQLPAGVTAVGIDEETAIVDMTGSGRSWQVYGRQQAWILANEHRAGFPVGSTLATGLPA